MDDYRVEPYETISKSLLPLLNNFNGLILTIEKMNDDLLTNPSFNKNKNFLNYINHFNTGRYFQFRAQGYLEALIQSNTFSKENLCYWLNQLVFPTHTHFQEAIKYFNLAVSELKSTNSATFNKLIPILEEFKRVGNGIIAAIKKYNLTCK